MNKTVIKQYPFYTAYSQLHDLYGMEIPEDLFEVYAISGWEKIGNKDYRLYRAHLHPEKCENELGWYVMIPCNCDIIESVTADFEDYLRTSSKTDFPGVTSLPNENFNEYMKFDPEGLYQSGKYVKYEKLGDKLYVHEPYPAINILYKGIYADEDGLPYLSIKEVEALASYCAFIQLKKEAYLAKNSNTLQLAQLEEVNWKRLCDAARVPQRINQNEMDEILNAKTSWNRKMYNKSMKPIV